MLRGITISPLSSGLGMKTKGLMLGVLRGRKVEVTKTPGGLLVLDTGGGLGVLNTNKGDLVLDTAEAGLVNTNTGDLVVDGGL